MFATPLPPTVTPPIVVPPAPDNAIHLSVPKWIFTATCVLALFGVGAYLVTAEVKKVVAPPNVTMPAKVTGYTGQHIVIKATTNATDMVFHADDPNLSVGDRTIFGNVATTTVTTDLPGTYIVYAVGGRHGYVSNEMPVTVVVSKRGPKPGPPDPTPDPPPVPVPPTPVPPKPPVPVVGTGAWIIIIKDDVARPVSQEKITDSDTVRSYLAKKQLRIYDSTGDSAKISAAKYDAAMKKSNISAPAMLVLDAKGKVLDAETLPTDEPTLIGKLKGLMAP